MSHDGDELELHELASRDSGDDRHERQQNMRGGYSPVYSERLHDGAFVEELDRSTVRKLDFILLPFLALLFLFNALDKTNVCTNSHFNEVCSRFVQIGNAEVRIHRV